MGKYISLIMITAIVSLTVILVVAIEAGINHRLITAAVSSLSSVFTGTLGVLATYYTMRRRQNGS